MTAAADTKQCTRCKRHLPLGEFVSARRGLVERCAKCRKHGRDAYHKSKPKRAGAPAVHSGAIRVCIRCEAEKPVEAFPPQKAGRDGRSSRCRDCVNAYWRDLYNAGKLRRPTTTPGLRRERHLRFWYGITSEQYDAMVAAQGGRCAICPTDTPGGKTGRWHIDHDHATGRVRGLLCSSCNLTLGQANENPDVLRKAAAYLEAHSARWLAAVMS